MNLSGNTILITGGTSGIGLELATRLRQMGNTVIVTGKDPRKIEEAHEKLSGIYSFQSDVSDPEAIPLLYDAVIGAFPALNILINNAGIMRKINLLATENSLSEIRHEIDTDLTGPVHMVKQFLPHLMSQQTAAIVNVSSGLAFVPFPVAPIYCAAKAGLHSFTQSLRVQLRTTTVKVFELTPPITQTPLLTKDLRIGELTWVRPMDLTLMVARAIKGLENDEFEIRPGPSNILKFLSRIAPQLVLNRLSKPVEAMLLADGQRVASPRMEAT